MDAPRKPSGPPVDLRPPAGRGLRDFVRHVYSKAAGDDIFFMAGAVTFNLLIVIVPLLFLVVGLAGYALGTLTDDPAAFVLSYILEIIPAVEGEIDLVQSVRDAINSLVAERTQLTLVGTLIFIWISTRLVGTLRTVLRKVFNVVDDRGIIMGKIFDAQIVLVGTLLVLVNLGATIVLQAVGDYGISLLGMDRFDMGWARRGLGVLISFASIWVLFLLIYRYLVIRRIPWRTALLAATFTSAIHEVLKAGFSAYATGLADFGTAFGNVATAAMVCLWIYYEAIVFILGGEVAQVYTMNPAYRLRRREVFSGAEE